MKPKTNDQDPAAAVAGVITEKLADSVACPARILSVPGGDPVALLPEGWSALSLGHLLPSKLPEFRTRIAKLHDITSFVAYVNRHATPSTVIYYTHGEEGRGVITAVLDDGNSQEITRRADRAEVAIMPDPRFTKWQSTARSPISQKAFIEFIEDHDRDFANPSGAKMRSLANGLEVKKLTHFKSVEKGDTAAADVSLIYETETKEQGEVKFPPRIQILIPIIQFGPSVLIDVAIRFRLEEGKLVFTMRMENMAGIIQDQWDALFTELRGLLPSTLILHGVP